MYQHVSISLQNAPVKQHDVTYIFAVAKQEHAIDFHHQNIINDMVLKYQEHRKKQ